MRVKRTVISRYERSPVGSSGAVIQRSGWVQAARIHLLGCSDASLVTGILIADERVLLTLRSATRHSYPSTWALPGGHVEPGESEVEALQRELREELGIDAVHCSDEPTSRLHLSADISESTDVSDTSGAGVHLSTWRVTSWRGEPTNLLQEEHERIAWFTAGELSDLVWAHPEHQQMLLDLLDRDRHRAARTRGQ